MKPNAKIPKKELPNKYDRKRAMIVRDLAIEYGITEMHVRACIRADKNSANAEIIRREYQKRYAEPYILK